MVLSKLIRIGLVVTSLLYANIFMILNGMQRTAAVEKEVLSRTVTNIREVVDRNEDSSFIYDNKRY